MRALTLRPQRQRHRGAGRDRVLQSPCAPVPQTPQHGLGTILPTESKRMGSQKALHKTSRMQPNKVFCISHTKPKFCGHNVNKANVTTKSSTFSKAAARSEHPDPTPLNHCGGAAATDSPVRPMMHDQDQPGALSRGTRAAQTRGRGVNSVCRRRGEAASPSKAAPTQHRLPRAGPVTGRHSLAARPGPENCLFRTNLSPASPNPGAAARARRTSPSREPQRSPAGPAAPARPRGRAGSPGGTGPAPTGRRQAEYPGRPAVPRRPYPQDVVALGAAAGDVDALRGAHGRERAATGTWHRALPPPGAGRGPTAAARGHGRALRLQPCRPLAVEGGGAM